MANQLKMADIQAILALHAQGWSQRAIAARLGVHRETVGRYVRLAVSKPANMHAPPGNAGCSPPVAERALGEEVSKPAKMHAGKEAVAEGANESEPAELHVGNLLAERASQLAAGRTGRRNSRCDPWRELIEAKRALGLTAQRIYQDLASEYGFTWSYSTVQRFVRRLERRQPLPFRRMECEPGEEAQVDFGTGAPILMPDGRRRRPHAFRIVLSYSRKAYSEVVERQTTESFLRCLENAFIHFGGVPRTLVIDNLRAGVHQADRYDPELNPKLRAFAAHYGVAILPTRPRTPRHKGKIERGVGYVKGNCLRGRTFPSIAAQNGHLLDWETNVADCRVHGTTRRQVGLVFREQEQPALQPLPGERFPMFHEAQRSVHRDGHVSVAKAYYSVPPEYVTRTVWVRWDTRLVRIFNQRFEQIAVHTKREPGKFSTQAAHVPAEKTSGIERGAAWLLGRARLIGRHAATWAAALLETRGIEGLRVVQGLLALAGRQPAAAIEEACEIAHTHRAYRLRTVRELIKRRASRQAIMEFMAEHALIRDLADYGAVARRMIERTALAADPGRGRNQRDPQVPSPEPPAAASSPSSFPSSLFPLNPCTPENL